MSATEEATLFTKSENLTEDAFAKEIKGELQRKYDSSEPTKKFSMTIIVDEVDLNEIIQRNFDYGQ